MLSSLNTTIATGHSAKVRIHAIAGEIRFRVAQVGPDFLIAAEPVQLPPSQAELIVEIDGHEKRRSIYLPDGVRAAVIRTPIKAA